MVVVERSLHSGDQGSIPGRDGAKSLKDVDLAQLSNAREQM